MDENELEKFLKDKADEIWLNDRKPYFLANVQPDLKRLNKDYRSALRDDTKLSDFARSLGSVRFIQHPRKPAIVGVIPLNENYDVEARAKEDGPIERVKMVSVKSREKVILDFLNLISELNDADLDVIHIPPRVLAKLLRDQ